MADRPPALGVLRAMVIDTQQLMGCPIDVRGPGGNGGTAITERPLSSMPGFSDHAASLGNILARALKFVSRQLVTSPSGQGKSTAINKAVGQAERLPTAVESSGTDTITRLVNRFQGKDSGAFSAALEPRDVASWQELMPSYVLDFIARVDGRQSLRMADIPKLREGAQASELEEQVMEDNYEKLQKLEGNAWPDIDLSVDSSYGRPLLRVKEDGLPTVSSDKTWDADCSVETVGKLMLEGISVVGDAACIDIVHAYQHKDKLPQAAGFLTPYSEIVELPGLDTDVVKQRAVEVYMGKTSYRFITMFLKHERLTNSSANQVSLSALRTQLYDKSDLHVTVFICLASEDEAALAGMGDKLFKKLKLPGANIDRLAGESGVYEQQRARAIGRANKVLRSKQATAPQEQSANATLAKAYRAWLEKSVQDELMGNPSSGGGPSGGDGSDGGGPSNQGDGGQPDDEHLRRRIKVMTVFLGSVNPSEFESTLELPGVQLVRQVFEDNLTNDIHIEAVIGMEALADILQDLLKKQVHMIEEGDEDEVEDEGKRVRIVETVEGTTLEAELVDLVSLMEGVIRSSLWKLRNAKKRYVDEVTAGAGQAYLLLKSKLEGLVKKAEPGKGKEQLLEAIKSMNGIRVTQGMRSFAIFEEACKGELRKVVTSATGKLQRAFDSFSRNKKSGELYHGIYAAVLGWLERDVWVTQMGAASQAVLCTKMTRAAMLVYIEALKPLWARSNLDLKGSKLPDLMFGMRRQRLGGAQHKVKLPPALAKGSPDTRLLVEYALDSTKEEFCGGGDHGLGQELSSRAEAFVQRVEESLMSQSSSVKSNMGSFLSFELGNGPSNYLQLLMMLQRTYQQTVEVILPQMSDGYQDKEGPSMRALKQCLLEIDVKAHHQLLTSRQRDTLVGKGLDAPLAASASTSSAAASVFDAASPGMDPEDMTAAARVLLQLAQQHAAAQ